MGRPPITGWYSDRVGQRARALTGAGQGSRWSGWLILGHGMLRVLEGSVASASGRYLCTDCQVRPWPQSH